MQDNPEQGGTNVPPLNIFRVAGNVQATIPGGGDFTVNTEQISYLTSTFRIPFLFSRNRIFSESYLNAIKLVQYFLP